MCTIKITIDEQAIAKVRPTFNRQSFEAWLQDHAYELVDDFFLESSMRPHRYSDDEMYAVVKERLQSLEDGTAELVDGEAGFKQLRESYGFKAHLAPTSVG